MLHDYSMYQDDPGFVKQMLPGVRSVLSYFASHRKPDGSLGRMPWWNFVDWRRSGKMACRPRLTRALRRRSICSFCWLTTGPQTWNPGWALPRWDRSTGSPRRSFAPRSGNSMGSRANSSPIRRSEARFPAHQRTRDPGRCGGGRRGPQAARPDVERTHRWRRPPSISGTTCTPR